MSKEYRKDAISRFTSAAMLFVVFCLHAPRAVSAWDTTEALVSLILCWVFGPLSVFYARACLNSLFDYYESRKEDADVYSK